MTNSTKAAVILWLTEMKQKGKARIQLLHKQFEKGEVEAFQIQEARKRYNCILDLLEIFQVCPDGARSTDQTPGKDQNGEEPAKAILWP